MSGDVWSNLFMHVLDTLLSSPDHSLLIIYSAHVLHTLQDHSPSHNRRCNSLEFMHVLDTPLSSPDPSLLIIYSAHVLHTLQDHSPSHNRRCNSLESWDLLIDQVYHSTAKNKTSKYRKKSCNACVDERRGVFELRNRRGREKKGGRGKKGGGRAKKGGGRGKKGGGRGKKGGVREKKGGGRGKKGGGRDKVRQRRWEVTTWLGIWAFYQPSTYQEGTWTLPFSD